MEITRKTVLVEALMAVEAMQRRFSKGKSLLEAEPGYELAWEQERKKAEILRRMIYETEHGPVADWQAEVMFGPQEQPLKF